MNLSKMSLADLKAVAKESGLKGVTGMKKADLIEKMIEFAGLNDIKNWSLTDEPEVSEQNTIFDNTETQAEDTQPTGDDNTFTAGNNGTGEEKTGCSDDTAGVNRQLRYSTYSSGQDRQQSYGNGPRVYRSRSNGDNTRTYRPRQNNNMGGYRNNSGYNQSSYRNNDQNYRNDQGYRNNDQGYRSNDQGYRNNDGYRNSYNNDQGYRNSYDQGYRNSYDTNYRNSYDQNNYGNSYDQGYRNNYDQNNYGNGYSQNSYGNSYNQNSYGNSYVQSDYTAGNSSMSQNNYIEPVSQNLNTSATGAPAAAENTEAPAATTSTRRITYRRSGSDGTIKTITLDNAGNPEKVETTGPNEDTAAAAQTTDQASDSKISERLAFDTGVYREGVLEVIKSEGFGFIRCDNYLPGTDDVYVSPAQIRRFNLKTGDYIKGTLKIKNPLEKYQGIAIIEEINGEDPEVAVKRPRFENLTPIFPRERIHFETPNCSPAMRLVDLLSPVGKGQRGMIVSPPKAGKTTLLKQMANAITINHPDMRLIILLIDERPEEVTDIKESIHGNQVEVIYSTFDELPENHKRVSEMVIERARRLVEQGHDVCILLDSITRLARAYNLTVTNSGRTLSGGLDPSALHMPKKFFGAARCMREGGSLTILATALVDTGSRMDDVVFEEFKGTGNMELVLDRSLSERRIFPAIDIQKSGTRRDDLLLTQEEYDATNQMRSALNSARSREATEIILNYFKGTRNNAEVIRNIKMSGIFGKY